jgi:hypothetical protein
LLHRFLRTQQSPKSLAEEQGAKIHKLQQESTNDELAFNASIQGLPLTPSNRQETGKPTEYKPVHVTVFDPELDEKEQAKRASPVPFSQV